MFGSPLRLVAPVLAVLVGLVAGCSADQGEAFDVAVAATAEALQAEAPTVEPTVVEPTATPEPVPTVPVTYDGVYSIEVDGSGDYATIEEALEQVTNGAELRLGAGTFLVTAPLVIDTDIVLTGAGQDDVRINYQRRRDQEGSGPQPQLSPVGHLLECFFNRGIVARTVNLNRIDTVIGDRHGWNRLGRRRRFNDCWFNSWRFSL